jgi:type I restriction enzyme, S subunit
MAGDLLKRVTGSTGSRQRAQPSQIARLPVCLPPSALVQALNAFAGPLLALIARNREQSETLRLLRDTLLPKLLSGDLRVPLDATA